MNPDTPQPEGRMNWLVARFPPPYRRAGNTVHLGVRAPNCESMTGPDRFRYKSLK